MLRVACCVLRLLLLLLPLLLLLLLLQLLSRLSLRLLKPNATLGNTSRVRVAPEVLPNVLPEVLLRRARHDP